MWEGYNPILTGMSEKFIVIFSIGFKAYFTKNPQLTIGSIFLLIGGVFMLSVGFFPCDSQCIDVTLTGELHSLTSLISAILIPVAITHHNYRYENRSSIIAVGALDKPNKEKESTFKELVYRNSLNMGAPVHEAIIYSKNLNKEDFINESLGNYLASKLEELGMKIEKGFIHRLVNREEKIHSLFEMIDRTDLIILTFPLYVDSLPAPVIKAMELIKEERDRLGIKKSKDFIAISNNGFPEGFQNTTALHICKIFAEDCGFVWKGGLALGQGGSIGGIPLLERGGMVRNVVKGLNITTQAMADGKEISQEAIDIFSKKFIPNFLYNVVVNLGWRRQAGTYGTKKKLRAKPYSL